MIVFHGEEVQIQQLSKRYGVPWNTIYNRYKRGLRGDSLVSKTPLTNIEFKGSMVGWTDLSTRYNIPVTTLVNRYKDGLRDDLLVKREHRGALSKNAANKLTEENVKEIKMKLLKGGITQMALAKQFNVDQSHISDIKRGKKWAEVVVDPSVIFTK